MTGSPAVLRDFTPQELSDALARGEAVLVDVREAEEFHAARIAGAVLLPLSQFDPLALPPGAVVLQCGVGKRSRMAAGICAQAGVAVAGHLAGGLSAWAAQGLPLEHG
jgi:rhodanese-related sulfurtransferase